MAVRIFVRPDMLIYLQQRTKQKIFEEGIDMSRRMMKELRTNVTCMVLAIAVVIGTFTIVAHVSPFQEPMTGYEMTI